MSDKPNKRIEHAVLDWNEVGTPVSNDFDDVYFSNTNGLEETRYVFLQQNGLPTRWEHFARRRFVVAETGFGTRLNFLALWQWFKAFRAAHPDATTKELHFISAVTTVQPSSSVFVAGVPRFSIGSIAKTNPGLIRSRVPRRP